MMSVEDCKLFDEEVLFSNFASDDLEQDSCPTLIKTKNSRKRKFSAGSESYVMFAENEQGIETEKDKYIQELEEQNSKLKAIIKRICGPHDFATSHITEDTGLDLNVTPMAVVLYLSNKLCQAKKVEVDNYFRELAGKDATKEVFVTQELKHQPSAIPLRPFSSDSQGRRFHKAKKGKKEGEAYIVSCIQYMKEFCIDRTGEPLVDLDPTRTQNWEPPVYEQVFFKALPVEDTKLIISVRKVRTTSCFNCDGNHNLNDCKEPRNHSKIAANRRSFQDKYGSPSTPDSRYHVSQEDDERFQNFQPGMLSANLREALGMNPSDLPPYIYKMRSLGYPPGYLKPLEPSLVIYNADGFVEETNENEDGEIMSPLLPTRILFPGFNAPLPRGVIDQGPHIGVPAYQPEIYDSIANGDKEVETVSPYTVHDDMEIGDDHLSVDHLEGPPLPSIDICEEKPPLPPDEDQLGYTKSGNEITDPMIIQRKVENLLNVAKKEAEHTLVLDSYLQGVQANEVGNSTANVQTFQQWWLDRPLSSVGMIYCTYTPPPSLKGTVNLEDLPTIVVTELDREPWKTASTSWYDPLYGDLAERTGMYESIRDILKKRRKRKRKTC